MVTTGPEKPWYLPAILAFIGEDIPSVVGLPPAAFARDVTYCERRVACEGESFITKTLPRFGKAIDLALQGSHPLLDSAFVKRRRSSALPAFLQALTRRVFSDDGYILEKPCLRSIRLLRQICFWGKKIQKGFTRESLHKATVDFIEVDRCLPSDLRNADPRLLGVARAVVTIILRGMPPISRWCPKHGPGNVASGEGVVGKRQIRRRRFIQLERVFRPVPYFFSLRDAAESPNRITDRIACDYGLSVTKFVEKDSDGPRTIGLEPAEYMWCQQALKGALYKHIESSRCIARGQINFTDQSINRELTREWARYVTLDMSKASDRNSLALVECLFARLPALLVALKASRTPGTILPDGQILFYKKFAPMGSAVCFPIEAIVFYALAVATLHLQGMALLLAMKQVYVYGDDLILPRGYFEALDQSFKSVGLLFSEGKCCIAGKFRESCGMDAYDGFDITPVRMRKVHPDHPKKAKLVDAAASYIPIVEHSNALTKMGYSNAGIAFRRAALRRFPILRKLKLPVLSDEPPFLAWYNPWAADRPRIKYRGGIPYVKGWVPEAHKVRGNPADEGVYYRESLCHGGAVGHLRVSPGHRVRRFDLKYATALKQRWVVYWTRAVETQ